MKIINNTKQELSFLEEAIESLYEYIASSIQAKKGPTAIYLESDLANAKNVLGKTAFYDPNDFSVHLFVEKRHPKDILRSFAHEVIHHEQNCKGEIEKHRLGDGAYAQNDEKMRNLEKEAYEKGNLLFRDWEDGQKFNSDHKFLNSLNNSFSNSLFESLKRHFTK